MKSVLSGAWSVAATVVLLVAVGGGYALGEGAAPVNAVLFGWDGAQRDHVKECVARGELPTLSWIAGEGTIVEIDIMRVTDTKAGWTQILTGYNPEMTGVYSNGRYEPITAGLTIFERLEERFGSENIATLAVIGKKGHVDADGPKRFRVRANQIAQSGTQGKKRPEGEIVVEKGVKYRVVPGKPYYNAVQQMDLFVNGLALDEAVGTKAMAVLEECRDKPFFLFVHFGEVDKSGHKHGENSKEYNDALISNDYWTGKIIDKLKELGLYEKTKVYITADHGFDEGEKGHRDAPYVFLATNDKAVMRRGERADITPTILEGFGIDLGAVEPPLDGHTLTKPYERVDW